MHLCPIGRSATSGAATVEDERAAHPLVHIIREIRQALELGGARRPQVVGALDHIRNGGRHFIVIVVSQRQQVGANGLVDAVLLLAVLVGLHQLAGLRANTIQHPCPHLGRSYRGDLAFGDVLDQFLNLDQFRTSVLHRCLA